MPTIVQSEHNPPKILGKAGAQLWGNIMSQYAITDAGGLAILQQACQCLDDAEACATQIAREGLTITNKQGITKPHPLLVSKLSARSLCCRLLAKLGLNLEPVKGNGRPSGENVGISWRDLPHDDA
jgi:P27 family predicted phage terminase small subunit